MGANVALERSLAGNESSNEAFALRLSNLLLPAPDAASPRCDDATEDYDHAIAPATARPVTRASARSATSASSG